MEKFQAFENWLKANGYVSWNEYMTYIRIIDKTLMVKDFEKITSATVLEQLMAQLQTNRAFAARTQKDRTNILSGFRLYIRYVREKNTK